MWQRWWVRYQPFIHSLYKKPKCILLSHFQGDNCLQHRKLPQGTLLETLIKKWQQWGCENKAASCVCRAEAPRQLIDPRVPVPGVSGRVLLLCSTEPLLRADWNNLCCSGSQTLTPAGLWLKHWGSTKELTATFPTTTVRLTGAVFLSPFKEKSYLSSWKQSRASSSVCGIVTEVCVPEQTQSGMQAESSLVTSTSSPRFFLTRRMFLALVSQHCSDVLWITTGVWATGWKTPLQQAVSAGMKGCWRHWNALLAGSIAGCNHGRAGTSTFLWVQFKSQQELEVYIGTTQINVLWKMKSSSPWLCGAIRPTAYTGIKSIQKKKQLGHEEANPHSPVNCAHISTLGWSSLTSSNMYFKLLMIISVIYMSQNYLKSTSLGAVINNAAAILQRVVKIK